MRPRLWPPRPSSLLATETFRHPTVPISDREAIRLEALGAFFVVFQGFEWIALIREGLTLTSSNHGSFFYLIVGMHGVHAVAGLVVLTTVWSRLVGGRLSGSAFAAARVFWYFVVGLWPVLYWRVYL